jgi:hypothetical protein
MHKAYVRQRTDSAEITAYNILHRVVPCDSFFTGDKK